MGCAASLDRSVSASSAVTWGSSFARCTSSTASASISAPRRSESRGGRSVYRMEPRSRSISLSRVLACVRVSGLPKRRASEWTGASLSTPISRPARRESSPRAISRAGLTRSAARRFGSSIGWSRNVRARSPRLTSWVSERLSHSGALFLEPALRYPDQLRRPCRAIGRARRRGRHRRQGLSCSLQERRTNARRRLDLPRRAEPRSRGQFRKTAPGLAVPTNASSTARSATATQRRRVLQLKALRWCTLGQSHYSGDLAPAG